MSWPLLYHSCLLHLFTGSLIHLFTLSLVHLFTFSPVHPFTFSQSVTCSSRSLPHHPAPATAGAAPSPTDLSAARRRGEMREASCSVQAARGSGRGGLLRRSARPA